MLTYFILQKTQAQWRVVFFISAAISTFGAVFYALAGSGEIQPWAMETAEKVQEDKKFNLKTEKEISQDVKGPESDTLL